MMQCRSLRVKVSSREFAMKCFNLGSELNSLLTERITTAVCKNDNHNEIADLLKYTSNEIKQ